MSAANLQQTVFEAMRAYQGGRPDDAERLAENALTIHPGHPRALEILGQIMLDTGRNREAAEYFSTALRTLPGDVELLNLMGTALAASRKFRPAVPYFQQAVQVAPDDARSWENLGKAAYQARRWSHARAAFEHCLALEPENDEATAGLARLELREGEIARAMSLASNVLGRNPDHLMSREVLAEGHLQTGEFDKAIAEAARITGKPGTPPRMKVLAFGIAAEASEADHRFDQAFDNYAAMNAAVAETFPRGVEKSQNRPGKDVQYRVAETVPELAAKAASWPNLFDTPAPIMFFGFASSGMSVLRDILLRHPKIVSSEKRKIVEDWAEMLWAENADELFLRKTWDDALGFRKSYWRNTFAAGIEVPDGGLMLECKPFYSQHLPSLRMVFPDAKYIFALRDPRDVVLSCFFKRASPSVSLYEFLSLEGTARYYDSMMTAARAVIEGFEMDLAQVQYDKIMQDREAEARRIVSFLGLEWCDGLLGDGTDAPPEARSIWRNYEAQLAPVMPLLDKWIKYFGYE